MTVDGQYTLETPENVEVDFELAGPGSRFCAMMVDMLLLFLLIFLLVVLLLVVDVSFWREWRRDFGPSGNRIGGWLTWVNALVILLLFGLFFGYHAFFEMVMRGQTPGKRYLKIRVIRDDGTPATALDIVIRNLVRMVDALPVGYGIGGVVMFFHPMNKRLGDLAAGTIVVKERELDYRAHQDKKHSSLAASAPVAANRELEPEERRVLSSFLHRRVELLPEARAQLAQRMARPLFEKYGGHFSDPESYIERLIEGKHHESATQDQQEKMKAWIEQQKRGS